VIFTSAGKLGNSKMHGLWRAAAAALVAAPALVSAVWTTKDFTVSGEGMGVSL
jgi:hypothetical protein